MTQASVLGPLAVETTGAGLPGLLLAGDAAGFIDPISGEELQALAEKIFATPTAVVERAKQAMEYKAP